MARVDAVRRADAVVSSNTSGIPIAVDRRRTLATASAGTGSGTHFFNPPRYLHLLELIPTAETDPQVVARRHGVRRSPARQGRRRREGRAGLHRQPHRHVTALMQIFRALESGDYSIEEIDAITGPAIGRPKSATFRTVDIAGVDVLAHVARTLAARLDGADDARSSRCRRSSSRWSRAG